MYYKSHNASSVCRYFGVSRKTFYKWLNRYENSGKDHLSLIDKSKRPFSSPNETTENLQTLIVRVRKSTGLGSDRLRFFIIKDYGISIPKPTIYAILKRKSLIKKSNIKTRKPIMYQMPYPGYIQMDIKRVPVFARRL